MASILTKILNTVQGYKAKNQSGSSSGWITKAIIAVVALAGIAFLAYKLWNSSQQLAKLLHEKAVKEEEAHRAEVAAKIAKEDEVVKESLQRNAELAKEIQDIDSNIAELTAARDQAHQDIAKLGSWDDVDEFIAKQK